MPTVDLRAEPLRALNRALHALRPDTNETRWTVVNPDGRHAIAAGLDAPSRSRATPATTAPA